MARVLFDGVTRHFPGAPAPAVGGVELEVGDEEVVVLTGPSGSGKTTLLRLAAGLELPDEGRVLIEGGASADPAEAEVALVFQNYAIYPNLTVRDNIALPLRRRSAKGKRIPAVEEMVDLLGLGGLVKQSASSLTPSDRMRVVLARSLVRRPDVLLMDEPLANLEPNVRNELRDQLVVAREAMPTTTLYASADCDELPAFGGRVVHLHDGRLTDDVLPTGDAGRAAGVCA
jgi:multiple sugar transport system ATP-binding protein